MKITIELDPGASFEIGQQPGKASIPEAAPVIFDDLPMSRPTITGSPPPAGVGFAF